jgi:hypothetical protein
MIMRKKAIFTALSAVIVMAFVCMAVRARDDTTRLVRGMSCEEANVAPGTVPAYLCLEGQYCTRCPAEFNGIGDVVSPSGMHGPMHRGRLYFGCSGDRFIGYCTGTYGVDYCDISQATVDGTCTNPLHLYESQPQGGGGGEY